MFIRFDTIHERDIRTDRHTDSHTQHDGSAALIHSIARQKRINVIKYVIPESGQFLRN